MAKSIDSVVAKIAAMKTPEQIAKIAQSNDQWPVARRERLREECELQAKAVDTIRANQSTSADITALIEEIGPRTGTEFSSLPAAADGALHSAAPDVIWRDDAGGSGMRTTSATDGRSFIVVPDRQALPQADHSRDHDPAGVLSAHRPGDFLRTEQVRREQAEARLGAEHEARLNAEQAARTAPANTTTVSTGIWSRLLRESELAERLRSPAKSTPRK
jgi:hypothetical protein